MEEDLSCYSPDTTRSGAGYVQDPIDVKRQLKAKQKQLIKMKFVDGNVYILREKNKDPKTFLLKKHIYTINDYPVNVLILKQLSGMQTTLFTLNEHDCKLYHIKYEPGLQVWPMAMPWKLSKKQK